MYLAWQIVHMPPFDLQTEKNEFNGHTCKVLRLRNAILQLFGLFFGIPWGDIAVVLVLDKVRFVGVNKLLDVGWIGVGENGNGVYFLLLETSDYRWGTLGAYQVRQEEVVFSSLAEKSVYLWYGQSLNKRGFCALKWGRWNWYSVAPF